jgi:Spy/CpxP family protein refolding chaperone
MTTMMWRAVTVAALILSCALPLTAQGREGRGNRQSAQPNPDDPAVTPAEIQRMFDSYALMQAQEQLKVTDDQFTKFLPRYKALQDARRRGLQERMRALNELRQMINGPQPADEAQLRERVKALDDIEARTQADVRRALDAIDQVLDVRQQAKFRMFEEMMERRKLELVTRARQANRKNQQ